MATFTSAANTGATEMELITSIVQEQLLREAKLLPTVTDYSQFATKGIKSIEIPRFDSAFSGPAVQNPDGVTEVAGQTVDFVTDAITLDDWTNLPYEIPDRVSRQTMISLEAELARSAGREYANYIDDKLIVRLKAASSAAPDHIIQLSGGTNDEITLADITEARRLLNVQNVPMSDRWLVLSPDQEKVMLNIDNFISADKYGAREALLDGEIGRVFGFRVMVHNGLSGAEALAYHKSAVAIAIQQDVKFESRRATLKLQKTEYSFTLGMGHVVLDGGKRQVFLNSTGA